MKPIRTKTGNICLILTDDEALDIMALIEDSKKPKVRKSRKKNVVYSGIRLKTKQFLHDLYTEFGNDRYITMEETIAARIRYGIFDIAKVLAKLEKKGLLELNHPATGQKTTKNLLGLTLHLKNVEELYDAIKSKEEDKSQTE